MYVILNKTKKAKKVTFFHIADDGSGMIFKNYESIDNSYSVHNVSDIFIKQHEIDEMSVNLNSDLFQVKTEKTIDTSYYYDSVQKDFFKIEHAEKPQELLNMEELHGKKMVL